MNTRVKGFVYLLLSAVYFGFMPLLVKVICADGSTIVGALFLRFALAIIPLYIYLKVRKVPMGVSMEDGKKILCVTVFGYGITVLFCIVRTIICRQVWRRSFILDIRFLCCLAV